MGGRVWVMEQNFKWGRGSMLPLAGLSKVKGYDIVKT
jgi:hypothetical protein